jgi:uncharacterized protein (DUF2235 family)
MEAAAGSEMTMALYAFDGTGNEDRDGDDHDSNVLDFFRAYADPFKNDDPEQERGSLYFKGIGVRAKEIVGKAFAEAFGIGGHRRIKEAMERLENNLEFGDTAIHIVGFSRGAALALSFANKIAEKKPHLRVGFLGLFDVVGEFGLPGEHINAGHNLRFPANVDHCCHAMALDETRLLFPLTRLALARHGLGERLREVWFRGVHSDIGGGNGNRGLNWIALHWMYVNARRHGLPIVDAAIAANLADKGLLQQIGRHPVDAEVLRKILDTDLLHASVSLDPSTGRRHNNPRVALARIDNEGNVTRPA